MSLKSLKQLHQAHLTEEEFRKLERPQQEKYLELLKQEVQYRQSKKLLFYEPLHDKMKSFHCSSAYTRAIFGANRSGKTTAGGVEFLMHITGLYPDWYPKELRFDGAIKGRIGAKDFQKGVGEVIIPFIEEWIDPVMVKKKIRNPFGVPIKWMLNNGSVFDILTYEQDTEQFEGWKGHISWFDEPPPRDKYVATLRGLVDYSGRNWLTLTPLTQPWIYDEIYTRGDKNTHVVTVDIRENKTLKPEAIAEFEKTLTVEEKEARLHGRFLHLSGLIYKEFDPNRHVCEPFQIPSHWTKYFAIDPHERHPTACLWLAVDPHDNHYVYDELYLKDMTVEQIAHAIHAQEGEEQARVRVIDPHMDKLNDLAGGFNVRKELMRYGVYCQRAVDDPTLGKNRVKQALRPKYSPILGTEVPQVKVFRTCQQTIYEFQHYIWAQRKRNQGDMPKKETPKKMNDHFMDCLKYIYNQLPRYINEQERENEEIEYTGTYTKRIKRKPTGPTSYYANVEKRAGQF